MALMLIGLSHSNINLASVCSHGMFDVLCARAQACVHFTLISFFQTCEHIDSQIFPQVIIVFWYFAFAELFTYKLICCSQFGFSFTSFLIFGGSLSGVFRCLMHFTRL